MAAGAERFRRAAAWVRLPHEAFGFAAVDLLLEEIAGTVGERHLVFDPELVARASSVGD
jgi:LacI family transcriptional regulator